MSIFKAMAQVMRDVEAIGKGQQNAQQGFKYRGIDDIYNSLHGLLAKNGIFTTPEVIEKTREERTNKNGTVLAFTCLRIKYTFWAEDGSSVSCVVEGEGMDSGDKSSSKALAIGHKYALLQTFCIPTAEEKDPDAEVHQVTPKTKQPVKPDPKQAQRDLYKKIEAEIDGALGMSDIDSIAAATAEQIETLPVAGQKALLDKIDAKRNEIAGDIFK